MNDPCPDRRNLVVCCDGTGDAFGVCNSNVVKLYASLRWNRRQLGYYHPGVGTMGAPTARNAWQRGWSRLLGLAFGAGVLADVADAYRFLMERYRPGDRIFLFGFSRGAYTVRALASLIWVFGLLPPGHAAQIPYLLRRLRRLGRSWTRAGAGEANAFRAVFSRPCPIHFLGVWDTVSSIGWIGNRLRLPYILADAGIGTARQALSIDERRCQYRDLPLRACRLRRPAGADRSRAADRNQDCKQVWFAGVHSDVGGSYAEAESGLSKLALEWMLEQAQAAGLIVDDRKAATVLGYRRGPGPPQARPDPNAPLHQSLRGWWWGLELVPERCAGCRWRWRLPLGRRRPIPAGACCHASLRQRRGYAPPNLPLDCGPDEPWVRLPCAAAHPRGRRDDGRGLTPRPTLAGSAR